MADIILTRLNDRPPTVPQTGWAVWVGCELQLADKEAFAELLLEELDNDRQKFTASPVGTRGPLEPFVMITGSLVRAGYWMSSSSVARGGVEEGIRVALDRALEKAG